MSVCETPAESTASAVNRLQEDDDSFSMKYNTCTLTIPLHPVHEINFVGEKVETLAGKAGRTLIWKLAALPEPMSLTVNDIKLISVATIGVVM
jgi:hypothetical protein